MKRQSPKGVTPSFLFFYCQAGFLSSCSFKAVGVPLCRDLDTVTPERIAQAIFFFLSFFFSFLNNCLNNKFLVVFFFFWKNNSPCSPNLFLRASEKKHLCSHFTVHYSTIISVLPSSLLAVSVLARSLRRRVPPFCFSLILFFLLFFFGLLWTKRLVVVVVVRRQVSEFFPSAPGGRRTELE